MACVFAVIAGYVGVNVALKPTDGQAGFALVLVPVMQLAALFVGAVVCYGIRLLRPQPPQESAE